LGLALAVSGGAAAEDAVPSETLTTVILVRHAEKVVQTTDGPTPGSDPPLTPAGEERARKLVHVLGGLDVTTLYSTPFRRTLATATPLAEALGLEVTKTPIEDLATYVATVVDRIRTQHVGEIVVVVSHSNTVPALITALGAQDAVEITDDEYDDLFVVTFSAHSEVRLLALGFGHETP
jgi:broad specificity phosphatase PhoE